TALHLPPQHSVSDAHARLSEVQSFEPHVPPGAQTNVQHSLPVAHAVPADLHGAGLQIFATGSQLTEQQSPFCTQLIPLRLQVPPPLVLASPGLVSELPSFVF